MRSKSDFRFRLSSDSEEASGDATPADSHGGQARRGSAQCPAAAVINLYFVRMVKTGTLLPCNRAGSARSGDEFLSRNSGKLFLRKTLWRHKRPRETLEITFGGTFAADMSIWTYAGVCVNNIHSNGAFDTIHSVHNIHNNIPR